MVEGKPTGWSGVGAKLAAIFSVTVGAEVYFQNTSLAVDVLHPSARAVRRLSLDGALDVSEVSANTVLTKACRKLI